MPKIPTAEDFGLGQKKVRSVSVGQNINTNAGMFGSNEGRQLQQLGDELLKTKKLLDDKYDEIEVTEAMTKYNEELRNGFKGEDGFLTRQGTNARNIYDEGGKYMDDVSKKYESGLKNKRQVELFRKAKYTLDENKRNLLNNHSTQQMLIANIEADNSYIQSGYNNVFDDPTNDKLRQDTISEIHSIIDKNPKGLSADGLKLLKLEASSRVHLIKLDYDVNNNVENGKKYFEENKENMTPKDRVIAEAKLKNGDIKYKSMLNVDGYIANGLSLKEQLDKANEIKNTDIRDETKRRIRQRYNENEFVKQEQAKELNAKAWGMIINEERPNIDMIDITTLSSLAPKSRIELEKYIATKNSGKNIETNWDVYTSISNQISDNPEEFMRRDLLNDRNNLSDVEYKEVLGWQRKIKEEGLEGKTYSNLVTNNQMLKTAMEAAGVKNAKDATQFTRMAQEELRKLESDKGGKATYEEKQKIFDKLSIKVADGTLHRNKYVYDDDLEIKDVPKDEIDDLAIALKDMGEDDISHETIRQLSKDLKGVPVSELGNLIDKLKYNDRPINVLNIKKMYAFEKQKLNNNNG